MNQKKFYIFLFLIIFGGAVLGFLSLLRAFILKEDIANEMFQAKKESFLYALEQRYLRDQLVLNAIKGFFESSDVVTESEWERFMQGLQLEKSFPNVKWIAFARLFTDKQTAQTDNSSFTVWPQTEEMSAAPVIYVFPPIYQGWIGYNLFASVEQKKGLIKARESNYLATTTALALNPIDVKRSELFWALPIQKGLGSETFVGWTVTVINFESMIRSVAAKTLGNEVSLTLYKGALPQNWELIFVKKFKKEHYPLINEEDILSFAGEKWTFLFGSTPKLEKLAPLSHSYFLSLVIALLTLVIAYLFYRKYSTKSIKEEMLTKSFETTILANLPIAALASDKKGLIHFINPQCERLLGYEAVEVLAKLSFTNFINENEMERLTHSFNEKHNTKIERGFSLFQKVAERKEGGEIETQLERKNLSSINVHLRVSSLINQEGQLMGYVFIITTTRP